MVILSLILVNCSEWTNMDEIGKAKLSYENIGEGNHFTLLDQMIAGDGLRQIGLIFFSFLDGVRTHQSFIQCFISSFVFFLFLFLSGLIFLISWTRLRKVA